MNKCQECGLNHDKTKETCKQAKDRVNELMKGIELTKSGWAGILGNGQLVDRRIHRDAIAVQENPLFGAPKPNQLPRLTEDTYNQAKERIDELISTVRTEEEEKEFQSLSDDIIEYEKVYHPIEEPELYTKEQLQEAFDAGIALCLFQETSRGNVKYENFEEWVKDIKPITM